MTAVLVTAGPRDFYPSEEQLDEVLYLAKNGYVVYVGDATGVDSAVADYCRKNQLECVIFAASNDTQDPDFEVRHVADWRKDGLAAGPKRNALMVGAAVHHAEGDIVRASAFWDGHSRGTRNALAQMLKHVDEVSLFAARRPWR